jgi:hypothetical protein
VSGNVISLDEHRPHLCVMGINAVHVVSERCIQDIIHNGFEDGKEPEMEDLIRGIVREWFETKRLHKL